MKKIAKSIASLIAGKKSLQWLFEKIHLGSLFGLNIGAGSNTSSSGEEFAIRYIKSKHQKNEKSVIFDVGANIGNYTILLNKVFNNNCTIYSFEPSKETFKSFQKNTENTNNINEYNFGFSDTESVLTLYSNKTQSGLSSIYNRDLKHVNLELNSSEEIELKTIDNFCNTNNIKHINFLKIDVEGHELKVLEGAKKMLNTSSIDYIQFEFGGCNIDSRTYFRDFFYLLNEKYRVYRIVRNGLFEIKKYKETYEVFITTNFLAERRDL